MKQEALIVDAGAAEIIRLHEATKTAITCALENALRIGELLQEHKARLGHGAFLPWVKRELPFSERTARNYMKLHERRATLKSANVADLASAYRLLTEHKDAPALTAAPVEQTAPSSTAWKTDPLWIPRPGQVLFWCSSRPEHEHIEVTIARAVEEGFFYVNVSDWSVEENGFSGPRRPLAAAAIGPLLWQQLTREHGGVSDFLEHADRFEHDAPPWTYNEGLYDSQEDAAVGARAHLLGTSTATPATKTAPRS